MKVLQINCVYNSGSTGKIVYDLHHGCMMRGIDSVVLYGRGERVKEPNIHKVSGELEAKVHSLLTRLFGVDFAFSPIATKRAIGIIKRENPDAVHLHCLNGHFINVYKLLEFLKRSGIKTVLTLHAEIMHTAGCEHAFECEKWINGCYECAKIRGIISHIFRDDAAYCYKKMKQAVSGFDQLTVVGVSDWLTERAKKSAIFGDKVSFKTVLNGVNTEDFSYIKSDIQIKKGGKPLILHITPDFNHPIKGGKYIIELAKMMPEADFLIVGFNGDKALLPENVRGIARTESKKQLAEYYSAADITVIASRRETFSMVVAESLCCGTEVAGFLAGGPETVAPSEHSRFVEFGNTEALKSAVEELLQNKTDKPTLSNEMCRLFEKNAMTEGYISLY